MNIDALERCLFRAGARHPFLREPIERFQRVPDDGIRGLATDGLRLYCAPEGEPEPSAVGHLLMHCLFRHLLAPENAVRPLWDLACDMAAEYLRTEFFPDKDAKLTRLCVADALPENVDPRVPGAVYRALMDLYEDELEPLYARFSRDDHRYWYAPPPRRLFDGAAASSPAADAPEPRNAPPCDGSDGPGYRQWLEDALESRWPSAEELPGGTAMTGRYGLVPGSREERLLLREAGRYDFSRYLRRYSTVREELRLDLGGFDYIPYYYGLARYGNLPLIEPLEYAECSRVEELVIAIDTSGSCARPVVERFLGEIQRILLQRDYFFKRMNVHIVQCDAMVQSHVAIHSLEEWEAYTKNIVIKGRGGTDFTPVFALVENLRKRGELKRLRGLLYFTDGDGVYPQKPTPYETAFVFSTRRALSFKRPEWIVPLCLERA